MLADNILTIAEEYGIDTDSVAFSLDKIRRGSGPDAVGDAGRNGIYLPRIGISEGADMLPFDATLEERAGVIPDIISSPNRPRDTAAARLFSRSHRDPG